MYLDIIRFKEITTQDGELKNVPIRAGYLKAMDNGEGYFLNIEDGMSISGRDWKVLVRSEKEAA